MLLFLVAAAAGVQVAAAVAQGGVEFVRAQATSHTPTRTHTSATPHPTLRTVVPGPVPGVLAHQGQRGGVEQPAGEERDGRV